MDNFPFRESLKGRTGLGYKSHLFSINIQLQVLSLNKVGVGWAGNN